VRVVLAAHLSRRLLRSLLKMRNLSKPEVLMLRSRDKRRLEASRGFYPAPGGIIRGPRIKSGDRVSKHISKM